MDKVLGRFAHLIHAALRIAAGFMFACHGAQKLFGVLGGFGGTPGGHVDPLSLLGAGAVIELVGGVLIAIGFRSSLAAFICSGEMAVAYFMFHQPKGPLPIQNGGELAALYSFVFLYLAARGPGILSVDGGGKGWPGASPSSRNRGLTRSTRADPAPARAAARSTFR